jgi:8-oxo-dGTP pyrophosphatase MutT (NUDIX family)
MLGKFIRIAVTNPIHSFDAQNGFEYLLNFGIAEGLKAFGDPVKGAYIMGLDHPVRNFDGRVIAIIHRKDSKSLLLVAAPKSMSFIDNEIYDALAFALNKEEYSLECLYEKSCGAVVYRIINDEIRFLLIKNKRSAHWGFPKGHVEKGETPQQTAVREVLEEAGLKIEIVPEFESKSEYMIQSRVEKCVTIFLAKTEQTTTTIQHEEIGDYAWLEYEKAHKTLRFDNDRQILEQASGFLSAKISIKDKNND